MALWAKRTHERIKMIKNIKFHLNIHDMNFATLSISLFLKSWYQIVCGSKLNSVYSTEYAYADEMYSCELSLSFKCMVTFYSCAIVWRNKP